VELYQLHGELFGILGNEVISRGFPALGCWPSATSSIGASGRGTV